MFIMKKMTDADRQKLRWMAAAAAAAVLYAVWFSLTGIGIPCPIRLVTGFKCPGCGITHMLASLLRGNLRGAWTSNPFLLVTSPVLLYLVFREVRKPETPRGRRTVKVILYTYITALVIFGVLRNIL